MFGIFFRNINEFVFLAKGLLVCVSYWGKWYGLVGYFFGWFLFLRKNIMLYFFFDKYFIYGLFWF